jgi:nicotinate-nucleotide adenylyltransferase
MNKSQEKVNAVFTKHFGRTPLKLRQEDILGEALELKRATDMRNLKEEAGDCLCSVLQLINENDWNADELVDDTLKKIARRAEQYKSLGRKIKVAIYGGAFNPIHKGHIQCAKLVLDTCKTFDEVWLVPCYEHMNGKELAAPEHRLAMAELARQVDGRIKVCDYEIKHQLKGEAYYFLSKLMDEDFAKDKYDFSFIIGMDNANNFDKWVNYEHLEKLIRFVVVPRTGVERDETVNWYLKPPHIYISGEKPLLNISSSEIRDIIKNTKFPGSINVLDPSVIEYITEHGLYK